MGGNPTLHVDLFKWLKPAPYLAVREKIITVIKVIVLFAPVTVKISPEAVFTSFYISSILILYLC